MQENKQKVIALTAGGTGGHIFPSIAIYNLLTKMGYKVIYITDKRFSNSLYGNDINLHYICSSPISGNIFKKLLALIKISIGIIQSIRILKKNKVDIIVGFGGYPSFPAMISAIILNLKSVLHEQNSVLGRVNRFLSPKVNKIITAFNNVQKAPDANKLVNLGTPVRDKIKKMRNSEMLAIDEEKDIFQILVIGGSQGARIFSEVIPDAIIKLADSQKKHIRIDQQCRKEDIENVRKIYDENNINYNVATFFKDIEIKISSADLIIARSGASTISEITAIGKGSILIPYKIAADNHQFFNAKYLKDNDAAIIISEGDLNSQILSEKISFLMTNTKILSNMAANSYKLGKIDADKNIIELLSKL